jgi:hypothetical protein
LFYLLRFIEGAAGAAVKTFALISALALGALAGNTLQLLQG